MKKRNGSVPIELITVLIIILTFSLVGVISSKIVTEINYKIQNSSNLDSSQKVIVSDFSNVFPNIIDYGFLLVLIGVFIAIIISAFSIDAHPVMFFASLLILIIVLVLAGIFANVYSKLETSNLASEAAKFTIIPYVMSHLVMVFTLLGFTFLIVLYGKVRGGG